eukprot:2595389-Amphidinium_carterae.2
MSPTMTDWCLRFSAKWEEMSQAFIWLSFGRSKTVCGHSHACCLRSHRPHFTKKQIDQSY